MDTHTPALRSIGAAFSVLIISFMMSRGPGGGGEGREEDIPRWQDCGRQDKQTSDLIGDALAFSLVASTDGGLGFFFFFSEVSYVSSGAQISSSISETTPLLCINNHLNNQPTTCTGISSRKVYCCFEGTHAGHVG